MTKSDPNSAFRKTFNMHGHGFHASVMRAAEELCEKRTSKWQLEGTEFPVGCNGQTVHIDFINKSLAVDHLYMIAECKRADPARSNWCFARHPYSWYGCTEPFTQFDLLHRYHTSGSTNARSVVCFPQKDVMNIGFEIKSGGKGDSRGGNERAINGAVTQALRGTNGFIDYLAERSSPAASAKVDHVFFLPVVFTTAKLFVTAVDLGDSDLKTGDLSKDPTSELKEREWIWFNHNRSTDLMHGVRLNYRNDYYAATHLREFTRSVAIVSSEGIESFLTGNLHEFIPKGQ